MFPMRGDNTTAFTKVFMDRVLLQKPGDIHFISEGLEHLRKASTQKTGGIILMSHVGNWEVAVRLLKELLPEMDLLLYMGIKHKEQIEGIQKNELDQAGIKIVAVGPDGGSPFDLVEGINLLKAGGFVSMTGDILWHDHQRSVRVRFLEHEVSLPQAPHLLALLSGKPLFIFFSFRTAKGKYLFKASGPISSKRQPVRTGIARSGNRPGNMPKSLKKIYGNILPNGIILNLFWAGKSVDFPFDSSLPHTNCHYEVDVF